MFSKISVVKIVTDHIETLRNDSTRKRSWGDIFAFFAAPPLLAGALLWCGIRLTDSLASVLATALSIFAALLFNLLLLIFDLLKKEEDASYQKEKKAPTSNAGLRKRVLGEVAKNISFCILLSLIVIAFVVVGSFKVSMNHMLGIVSLGTFAVGGCFFVTLLMILKRIHNLLVDTFK